MKKKITINGGPITVGPSPLYQRCTAAKDGKLQRGRCEQTDAVECFDGRKQMNQLEKSKRINLRKQSFAS